MKRLSTIIMALVLALGLTQCKKEQPVTPELQGDTYTISLSVKSNNGAKVDVNTTTGSVDYSIGDQILVASDGKYVGTLEYDGTLFTGPITNVVVGLPLQFYFLGNVTPAEELTSGITESCSVLITDQTQHLPVISAAPSNENFDGELTEYTAELLNKCALVKFNVTTAATNVPTCLVGFNNKVTVSFAENTFTSSKEGEGVITLPAGNGEKWAILMPQAAMTGGEAYSANESHIGTFGNVPTTFANGMFTVGVPVEVNTFWHNIVNLSTLTDNYEAQDNDLLTGTLGDYYKITVADGATVTLLDATINYANSQDHSYAGITCLGDATLVIEGSNTVKPAYYFWPAIYVPTNQTLTIRGEGTLNAIAQQNGPGAGIGAGYSSVNGSCGNIVIESGTIIASGYGGAGIGAGMNTSCGDITILGGDITASSYSSAGIGGGQSTNGTCGAINISNCTVHASGYAAGIGGGASYASCNGITISNSNITATASSSGAGIGCGPSYGTCGDINISNSDITASSNYAPAIGAASGSNCGHISLSGSTITARGGSYSNIGGAAGGGCGNITITDCTVETTNANAYTGIGAYVSAACGDITISGSNITTTARYVGIGGVSGNSQTSQICGNVSINSSTVYAKATQNNYGCAIGISQYGTMGTVTIANDVELTAIKANGAAYCIGKGYSSPNITIGTITIGGTEYPDGVNANQADGVTFVYPVQETTITWNSSFIGSISHSQFDDDASVSQNGITASFTFGVGLNNSELIIWSSPDNQLTFTSTVGNFSKIEIYIDDVENMPEDQGWTFDGTKMTWEGTPASSVSLSGNSSFGDDIYISSISQIVFTVQ